MKRYSILFFALLLAVVPLALAQDPTETPAPEHAEWTYEGVHGPEHWGALPGYELCGTGEAQSPIDINAAQGLNLTDITFNYEPSALNIFNNGETIRVNYGAGSSITYNEIEYHLLQFHFHIPSEHTIAGETFPMELHFVHQSETGALAVVGVLLSEGETNAAAYAPVFDNLPAEKGEPQSTELMINAADLLPADAAYYTYTGSLTTPPCSQGVRWLLLKTPVEVSADQLAAFEAIFELSARPVQPLNDRDLLEDTN